MRDSNGYPIELRAIRAQEYAAAAKERNHPQHQCQTCQQQEKLPAVMRILARVEKQRMGEMNE